MSTHTILATMPHGDPDIGADVDALVTFEYRRGSPDYWNRGGGHWEQGYAAEVEFVKAQPIIGGKPSEYGGAYADLEQGSLDNIAEGWLESDEGYAAALEQVASDDEAAREYAAELRADR